jgi:tripartite-type tricarboxylate transporter receptor subunit TctC
MTSSFPWRLFFVYYLNVLKTRAAPAAALPSRITMQQPVRTIKVFAACVLCLAAAATHAQDKYPSRPIRVVTPFAPGGGSDTLARLIGPQIHEAWGQPVIVDNRGGGGGTIGAAIVVNAPPDGYTLILVSGSYGANAALHRLPYDTVTDIQPIILIGETGLVVTMHPTSPVKSIKDFIDSARANPGKFNFGSSGAGGLGHLAGELFMLDTKVRLTHVPYKGTGPVMTALLGAEVHTSFSSMVPSIPHIRSGRLRPIGVTPAKRWRALPDVPSISESVPGYEVVHWYGIWGPKALPQTIITRWNNEVARIIKTEPMQKWFENEGMEPAAGPPRQFFDRIKSDAEKWKRVVREAKIPVAGG